MEEWNVKIEHLQREVMMLKAQVAVLKEIIQNCILGTDVDNEGDIREMLSSENEVEL